MTSFGDSIKSSALVPPQPIDAQSDPIVPGAFTAETPPAESSQAASGLSEPAEPKSRSGSGPAKETHEDLPPTQTSRGGAEATEDETQMKPFNTDGLGGALRAPHLRNDSVGAASTTAVADEPVARSSQVDDDSSRDALEPKTPSTGKPSLSESIAGMDLNRGDDISSRSASPSQTENMPSEKEQKHYDPESSLAPHPEGKPGAYDVEGRKVHEASDPHPGPFGVMGGAHLNSPDNRPETAGRCGPKDGADQGLQTQGIFGPGPVITALPPTEADLPPTSAQEAEHTDSGSSPAAHTETKSHHLGSKDEQLHAQEAADSRPTKESTATSTRTAESTGSTFEGVVSESPAAQSEPPPLPSRPEEPSPFATTDGNGSAKGGVGVEGAPGAGFEHKANEERLTDPAAHHGGEVTKNKVPLGDKVKGFVKEAKGHLKKDPEAVEAGKALRHGDLADCRASGTF